MTVPGASAFAEAVIGWTFAAARLKHQMLLARGAMQTPLVN